MKPDKALIDDLYRQQVLHARAQPPEEKLLAGLRLLDSACRVLKDGIRAQYPAADEERANEILRERLALARRLEQEA